MWGNSVRHQDFLTPLCVFFPHAVTSIDMRMKCKLHPERPQASKPINQIWQKFTGWASNVYVFAAFVHFLSLWIEIFQAMMNLNVTVHLLSSPCKTVAAIFCITTSVQLVLVQWGRRMSWGFLSCKLLSLYKRNIDYHWLPDEIVSTFQAAKINVSVPTVDMLMWGRCHREFYPDCALLFSSVEHCAAIQLFCVNSQDHIQHSTGCWVKGSIEHLILNCCYRKKNSKTEIKHQKWPHACRMCR